MRSLVVDDSRLAASALVKVVMRVDAQGACDVAYSASDANRMCMEHPYDVVFLDIEMPGANGLTLANRLRLQSPQTNVVFVTGYPEYALDAWNTQASCFLVKPVDEEDVRRALDQLRNPVVSSERKGLYIQCFGNFEVFYDGVPVAFERSHTKELLAYLVDRRGALVSTGELVAVLWEDRPDTVSRRSQLRTFISELRRVFTGLGRPDAIVRQRGGVAVKIALTECDYYGFCAGLPEALNLYRGEYMCQYSWAENTTALLDVN